MTKELIPFTVNNLPSISDEIFGQLEEVSKGSDYLPRLQLITKGKYIDKGKISPGRWGIPQPGGEEIVDLGDSIDILPFAARPKALDVADRDAVIAVYDVNHPEFQRIKAAPKNTGALWGPSFLVLERSTGKLFELFFGNASGRNEAANLRPFLPRGDKPPEAATLSIRLVEKQTYSWHVPVVSKCSEPITQGPTADVVRKEVARFMTPPEEGVEKVQEATEARAR